MEAIVSMGSVMECVFSKKDKLDHWGMSQEWKSFGQNLLFIYFENTCLDLKIFKVNKGPMPVLSEKKKEEVQTDRLN